MQKTAAKKTGPAPQRPRTKGVIDFASAYGNLNENATANAESRFDRAARIVDSRPSALHPVPGDAAAPAAGVAAGQSVSQAPADPSGYEVGKVYAVPVSQIDPNQVGVRHYYRASEIDRIGISLEEGGQKVAVNGFVKPNGRIELIDGGTRLRSAKSAGLETLDVKIEKPPADLREQYKRSAALNDERSDHTALDTAVLFRRLLDEGVYASQDELAADMKDRKGAPLSKTQVSMYLRIEKIPDRLRRQMIDHEQTTTLWIAYEISGIFVRQDYDERREEYDRIAEEVIKEIQDKSLGKLQAQSLIQSKLTGPKNRTRGDSATVKYGDKSGVIKTFEGRGQLDFSIKGLDPAKLRELREGIEKLCTGQLPLGAG